MATTPAADRAEHVRRLLDAAPPLSSSQRDRIAVVVKASAQQRAA